MRVNSLQDENKKAAVMAEELIRRCATRLERPCSDFLSESLVQGQDTESVLSDRKDQLALVLELARVAPEMLVSVLPQFQSLLLDESVDIRFPFVKLVASIAVNHPVVARDYNSLLIALFRRIIDADADVRLFMCSHAKTWLLQYFSTHADYLEGISICSCFVSCSMRYSIASSFDSSRNPQNPPFGYVCTGPLDLRGQDVDDRVRAAIVTQVFDAALEQPQIVSGAFLQSLAKRTIDKKVRPL
jgi:hypothetical protein